MALYLFAALLYWNPAVGWRGHTQDSVLRDYAEAIDAICVGPRECLMLAAIPSREGHFAPWILDHSCNRRAWRAAHPRMPHCDHGRAWGAWQIHRGPWSDARVGELPTLVDEALVARKIYRTSPYLWTTRRLAERDVDAYIAIHLPPSTP